MKMKNELKVKANMSLNESVSIIDDLLKSFKKGTVCIQNGDDVITLNPASNIDLEIKADQKKNKEKITIELKWQGQENDEEQKPENNFKISSEEPVISKPETPINKVIKSGPKPSGPSATKN